MLAQIIIRERVRGSPGGSVVKNPPVNTGDMGLIPGSRRPPGVGNSNPLQYSYPENPMDRGTWRATVYGVAKSQSDLACMHATPWNMGSLAWYIKGKDIVFNEILKT